MSESTSALWPPRPGGGRDTLVDRLRGLPGHRWTLGPPARLHGVRHAACCDSSPNRHATKHFEATGHPLMQSYEPGEDWWWCYVDQITFEVEGAPSFTHP